MCQLLKLNGNAPQGFFDALWEGDVETAIRIAQRHLPNANKRTHGILQEWLGVVQLLPRTQAQSIVESPLL